MASTKLTVKFNGADVKASHYPFPIRAKQFDVTVNGAPAKAAQTKQGKYTYFQIPDGPTFYVEANIPAGSDVGLEIVERAVSTTEKKLNTGKKAKKAEAVAA